MQQTVAEEILIKEMQPEDVLRWDDFVMSCDEATFFHRAGWKEVIERSFGHKTYFLYAEISGQIKAVMPLGHIKSFLFGNALTSFPFCVYGGIAGELEAARTALNEKAIELARSLKVDFLEMRYRDAHHTDWQTKDLYVTFRKNIDPDPEKNMLAIPRKQRAMVRKGINSGLGAGWDESIDCFYEIYCVSVRNHGTPVFPKKYFSLLKGVFGNDCKVLTVVKEGQPVSSVMSFYFRDEVLPYYGGGTLEARKYNAFDFMYWQVMLDACEQGYKVFDYGRSKKGTGSYSFKKNWGFEPEPLPYEYFLVNAKEVPDINPLNPKFQLFIKIWRQLPLPVSKVLGPMIARNLG